MIEGILMGLGGSLIPWATQFIIGRSKTVKKVMTQAAQATFETAQRIVPLSGDGAEDKIRFHTVYKRMFNAAAKAGKFNGPVADQIAEEVFELMWLTWMRAEFDQGIAKLSAVSDRAAKFADELMKQAAKEAANHRR